MVSEPLLKRFQEIIKEDYGKDITLAEAAEFMNDAVGYFDVLAKVHYREEVENIINDPNDK
jgi:uncharacterized protein (DUF927 family)